MSEGVSLQRAEIKFSSGLMCYEKQQNRTRERPKKGITHGLESDLANEPPIAFFAERVLVSGTREMLVKRVFIDKGAVAVSASWHFQRR